MNNSIFRRNLYLMHKKGDVKEYNDDYQVSFGKKDPDRDYNAHTIPRPSRQSADTSDTSKKLPVQPWSNTGSSWGKEGSQEFKDNKKAYNQWYYSQHKDYWKNYYQTEAKNAASNAKKYNDVEGEYTAKGLVTASKARAVRDNAMKDAYRYAGEAYSKAMGNVGKTYSVPTTMLVSDIARSYRPTISAGNDYIESRTGTVGNESLIENMWKSGVSSIIKAGKSFLNAWKSGLGF